MRKEYRKAVRGLFREGIKESLPGFELVKIKAPVLFGGETVFHWVACEQLHCFIILAPDAKGRQAFTVELAWSSAGRFPEVTARPSVMLAAGDPDPTDVTEGIVRLGGIAHRRDLWWDLPDPALERPGDLRALQESLEPVGVEQALAHATAPVNSALRVLLEGGVRFFEDLAAQRCGVRTSPREGRPSA